MAYNSVQKRHIMRSTSAQINLLVDYMSVNKDFANGSGQYAGVAGARKADEEWEGLREQLKQHGTDKSVMQWKLTWRDLKRKARKTLRDNKDQLPVVSNATFKVLKAIDLVDEKSSVEIETVTSVPSENWEFESEDNSQAAGNETDHANSEYMDKASNNSSETEVDDMKSVVEVVVPRPRTTQVYCGSLNKPQRDPLQTVASAPRMPRLAPKPSKAITRESVPTVTRRRQLLKDRAKRVQHASPALPSASQHTTNSFVTLELQRLKMDEERDRRLHEREMERLKLELQRIEVQRNHNELLQQLVNIAQNTCDLLQQRFR